jgi:hypothetical protein
MKIGAFTVVAAATDATAAKALGQSLVPYVLLYNAGSNPVAVNSGDSTITVTFPTTGTGQNCSVIAPGAIIPYEKNNPKDTHMATICATGLTTTLYIQTGEGT